MNEIKVSVVVITYKHAQYISQCLDSILSQKVNFKYEIVVGEDCSNDGTREILLEYKEKYPNIFVLLLNEKNMGVSRNGHNVRLHCRGQYMASCEGDDFWIDDTKLQKQVDFLDSHPEYAAVGTNSVSVDHDGNNPKVRMLRWQVNKTYTLKHFLRYGMIIHGNTLMRRNRHLDADEKYQKLRFAEPTMGDVITRVTIYDEGPIFVLPIIAHAHRDGSMDKTSFTATSKNKLLEHTNMYFRIVDNVTSYYEGKYNLEALKANRVGGMIMLFLFVKGYEADKSEFKKLWKTLPLKLKLMSIGRFVQKIFRKVLRKIGRKLRLYYKNNE